MSLSTYWVRSCKRMLSWTLLDWSGLARRSSSIWLQHVSFPTSREARSILTVAGDKWSNRVASICLSAPQHKVDDLISIFDASDDFLDLLSRKCRAYFVCQKPRGTVVAGREDFGCNCFASGEQLYSDQIIVRDWGSMLDHFNAVHTIEGYEEPERFAVEDDDSG